MTGNIGLRSDARAVAVGAALVAAIGLVRVVPLVTGWQHRVVGTARAQLQASSDDAAMARELPALRTLTSRLTASRATLDSAEIVAPSSIEAGTQLMKRLARASDDAELALGNTQLLSADSTNRAGWTVRVRAQLAGDLDALVLLLSDLEAGPPVLSVTELSVTRADRAADPLKAEMLQVDITIAAMARRGGR